MRVVIVGASNLGLATAQSLLRQDHDVILIERDKDKIASLSDNMDCGFLHGDGTKPAILKEADPARTDVLICVTNSDQDNILAGLVGRSLGFPRVIPKLEDPEFDHICIELGLEDTIVPDWSTARTLSDMVAGLEHPDLSTMVKGEVRFFSFVAREDDAGKVKDLGLPDPTQVVCLYRGDDFRLAEGDTDLKEGDEVVLVTHARNLPKLRERWEPPSGNGDS